MNDMDVGVNNWEEERGITEIHNGIRMARMGVEEKESQGTKL